MGKPFPGLGLAATRACLIEVLNGKCGGLDVGRGCVLMTPGNLDGAPDRTLAAAFGEPLGWSGMDLAVTQAALAPKTSGGEVGVRNCHSSTPLYGDTAGTRGRAVPPRAW